MRQVSEEVRPVDLGLALGHPGHALAGRLRGHEYVAGSAAPVLDRGGLAGPVRRGPARASRGSTGAASRPCKPRERPCLRTPVHVEDLLHGRREVRVALRRDHPSDPTLSAGECRRSELPVDGSPQLKQGYSPRSSDGFASRCQRRPKRTERMASPVACRSVRAAARSFRSASSNRCWRETLVPL